MKRRELLQQMAVLGTVLAPPIALSSNPPSDRLGPLLPQRPFGRSGEKVTCLGLGGFHLGWPKDEAVVQATIEKALEVGIRFFDTAESYGKGRSEERYGRYLIPKYRDDIFLMTKTTAGDAQTAREHLEGSLRRMKTERVDLWQIHSLKTPEDTDRRLANGVLEEALKAKKEGKVRYIGFTGHTSPYALNRMTEDPVAREACMACQLPVNPVDAASNHSFVNRTIPKLIQGGMAVLAMKTLADGRFFAHKEMNGNVKWTSDNPVIPGALTVEECILFALSLPISVLITGAEKPDYVIDKAGWARRFTTLSAEERMAITEKVAAFAEEGSVEYYKNEDLRGNAKPTPLSNG